MYRHRLGPDRFLGQISDANAWAIQSTRLPKSATHGFKNMTAMSCSIRFAKHDMGVNLRPVIFESDITD
jgi:hypothetical protein